MKLVDDQKGYETKHVIINGDGTYPDKLILKIICEKYNGDNKIISYPRTGKKRQAGLSALNSIKTLLDRGFYNFIFIVDGEHIEVEPKSEIKKILDSIGVDSEKEIILHQDAFLMKCRSGHHNIYLYCIISGPDTFIEEEVKKFIELKLNIKIKVSVGKKDSNWKHEMKREIERILKEKNQKLKRLLEEAGRNILEESFPNICAVLKEVEKDFERINQ